MRLADVPAVANRPSGYRQLGYVERETEGAALFEYRGVKVWIPKKALRFVEGRYHAPGWAIYSSKQFQQERRG